MVSTSDGASRLLAGEPREIGGHARDRYVYAATNGVFRTKARIGDIVSQGQDLGKSGSLRLASSQSPLPSTA